MDLDLPTDKVIDLLSALENKDQLEDLGRILKPPQLADLWQKTIQQKPEGDRLAALFVGVAPAVFSQTLKLLDDKSLALLKETPVSEPLLHHMTLHTHVLEQAYADSYFEAGALERLTEHIDPKEISLKELYAICEELDSVRGELEETKKNTARALGLAWSYERRELIDKLSLLKENCEHALQEIIGERRSEETLPTGIYGKIEERLISIFGKLGVDKEALHDDDSAVEALPKLSIWYLEDFSDVGLLPSGDVTHMDWGQALRFVEARLAQAGLHTVADIKKYWIFSRAALKERLKSKV